jgi:hypothetical protein
MRIASIFNCPSLFVIANICTALAQVSKDSSNVGRKKLPDQLIFRRLDTLLHSSGRSHKKKNRPKAVHSGPERVATKSHIILNKVSK